MAAYLVDAETGELRETLSSGQRLQDLDIAETNLAGELLDLQMSGLLPESVDPLDTATSVITRYEQLWAELTAPQTLGDDEFWRIERRLRDSTNSVTTRPRSRSTRRRASRMCSSRPRSWRRATTSAGSST